MRLIKSPWFENVLYKHDNNTDVAIQVLESFEEEDGWNLYVMWYNLGSRHEPYSMGIRDTIKVKSNDTIKWKILK